MSIVMGALALMQAGVAAGQMIMGSKQQKKAQSAADQAMNQKLALINEGMVNQYSGLQAPTKAFDLQDQQTRANIASGAQALQEGGAETVIGGVGNLVQAGHQAGLETAAKREAAEFEVDKLKAAEEARLADIKYQGLVGVQDQELAGAQRFLEEGRQNFYTGLSGISSAVAGLGGFLGQKEIAKVKGYKPIDIHNPYQYPY